MKSSRGFTLIELLIVIAIIGILMSLLFPAIQTALDAAKKAQAKNDVTQLATAVTAYEVEYGKLPSTTAGEQTVSGAVFKALAGTDTNLNPRQIVFFEAKNAKGKKGGYDTGSDTYYDPWGGTYFVIFDTDYDTLIANTKANSITNSTIRKKVAVFNTNAKTKLRVASWE